MDINIIFIEAIMYIDIFFTRVKKKKNIKNVMRCRDSRSAQSMQGNKVEMME